MAARRERSESLLALLAATLTPVAGPRKELPEPVCVRVQTIVTIKQRCRRDPDF
jgi:hypothetical protein